MTETDDFFSVNIPGAPCNSLATAKPKIIVSAESSNSDVDVIKFYNQNMKEKRDRTTTCRSCQDSDHIDVVRNGSAEGFDLT